MAYPEEKNFLNDVQKGNMLFGGAGFLRVVGNNVLLMNSFRLPFDATIYYGSGPRCLTGVLRRDH